MALPSTLRSPAPPTWDRPRAWPRCITYPPHLRRTALTALAVGSLLFLVNHLATVLAGAATAATWVGTGVSYVVPFCVANIGVLVGTRQPPPGRAPSATTQQAPTGWSNLHELPAYLAARTHLQRTLLVALVVGTCYLIVNQLPVLLAGHPPTRAWVAVGIDYVVPFCVSNAGLAAAGRRRATGGALTSRRVRRRSPARTALQRRDGAWRPRRRARRALR